MVNAIKLVASDLDGTLLNAQHDISVVTRETLQALHQQHYRFVFSTGRHHIDVASIRQKTGIPAYMVTSNGACIHSPDNQKLAEHYLPPHLVQAIIDVVKTDPEVYIHLYQEQRWLLNQEDPLIKAFNRQSGFMYDTFSTNDAPTQRIYKVFFTHKQRHPEAMIKHEQALRQVFQDQLSVVFSTPWCLEVMAKGVSKGQALATICQHEGIELSQCMAFGDGMNDQAMLEAVGQGLIMDNAHQRLKHALPSHKVIGHHDQDAVADYLQRHLLTTSPQTA
ncbi:Cof-type HAD-IIB family hydrolase [Vibrio sp. HB161653]|uniref:Cof-type HAD-IIB family hydrolase n=1 Tax=Vibrio sp. HB236076 TaxID=3232307 RepID=A0AB39HJH3_9VIBR|nr:Cof-type HAD-IIB family hydrolase [Vibrio sp. HB161653]MDP5255720.1 Cof-type HAD-IIB family hydrolase [Vibrio sp. HB161653]